MNLMDILDFQAFRFLIIGMVVVVMIYSYWNIRKW